MAFADVIGHERAIAILRRALLTDRIAHAYLFSGPPSVGKRLVALNFAKAANCLRADEAPGEACDACAACRKIESGAHPDVRVIAPALVLGDAGGSDGGEALHLEGTMIRSEQVEAVVHDASLAAAEGRRKFYIVARAEAMNETSANKILKTLEEPPGRTTFVLTTPHGSQVLPTIQSRCQALRFNPVPDAEMLAGLTAEFPDVGEARVRAAVALAGGRVGWAKRILSRPQVLALRDTLLRLAASLPDRQPIEALSLAEQLSGLAEAWWIESVGEEAGQEALSRNRDRVLRTQVGELLDVLLSWFRDLSLLAEAPDSKAVINADHATPLRGSAARASAAALQRACQVIPETKRNLQVGNANLRLALENLAIDLIAASRPA
jgi:DNA polymerase-3 subunit delta'